MTFSAYWWHLEGAGAGRAEEGPGGERCTHSAAAVQAPPKGPAGGTGHPSSGFHKHSIASGGRTSKSMPITHVMIQPLLQYPGSILSILGASTIRIHRDKSRSFLSESSACTEVASRAHCPSPAFPLTALWVTDQLHC